MSRYAELQSQKLSSGSTRRHALPADTV